MQEVGTSVPFNSIKLLIAPLCNIAVGGIFGWRLSQHGMMRVSVVCRSNYERVKERGFLIESSMWGNGSFLPHRVVRSARELSHIPFDYVICANRLITRNLDTIIPEIKPTISPKTTIVMTQNGIGVEQPVRNAFPDNPITSAICHANCIQVAPGIIKQVSQVHPSLAYSIGVFKSERAATEREKVKVKKLVSLDSRFGETNDIQIERWMKIVINGAWNPVTAILGLETHQVIEKADHGLHMVSRLSNEIYQVGVAEGVSLPANLPFQAMDAVAKTKSMVTSMLRDARAKRKMEIETLCGPLYV